MDDLLREFRTETAKSLDVIDVELVRFESHPSDRNTLNNIFRLVHTIKGTCGFLGLPRPESVANARETLLGRFRDGQLEVTPVPLSAGEIAGVLNLRRRIVTAIDARSRLGLAARAKDEVALLAIGVEREGESFGLIIDEIGEVVRLDDGDMEENPANLAPLWARVSRGVYRLDGRHLVIMDIDRVLADSKGDEVAAAA